METTEDIIEDIVNNQEEDVTSNDVEETQENLEGTIDTAEEIVSPEEFKVPEQWEQPIKDFFQGFDEKKTLLDRIQDAGVKEELSGFLNDGRTAFFDKFKNLDSGWQAKYKDFAEKSKTFDQEREAFEDNRGLVQGYKALEEQARQLDGDLFNREISRLGGTNNYLLGLHQVNSQMETDPLGTITSICDAYGITPEMLTNGAQDPSYLARQSQQQNLKYMDNIREQTLEAVREELSNYKAEQRANSLFTAKDETGNLKYRNLDKVQDDVAMLMEAKGLDLDSAYAAAKLLNPEVFKDEAIQKAEAQVKQEEIERAKTVKNVKKSPKSSNSVQSNLTKDDIIADVLRESGMIVD
jgi:hypothetical protein